MGQTRVLNCNLFLISCVKCLQIQQYEQGMSVKNMDVYNHKICSNMLWAHFITEPAQVSNKAMYTRRAPSTLIWPFLKHTPLTAFNKSYQNIAHSMWNGEQPESEPQSRAVTDVQTAPSSICYVYYCSSCNNDASLLINIRERGNVMKPDVQILVSPA